MIVLAFSIVYVVWGSTYLAIRFAIESIPPFLMAGSRFFTSGCVLVGVTWALGHRPERAHWKSAAILGALLLLGGNGLVTLAEKSVPSGLAALIVALVPIWTVLLDWLRPQGKRPSLQTIVGAAIGLAGVAWLSNAKDDHGHAVVDLFGGLLLLVATLSWSCGTIYGRHAAKSSSIVQFAGMQMLVGGGLMLLIGLMRGEASVFEWSSITRESMGAWIYLTVAGGIVAFTAYAFLVKATTPSKVSTTAYVNPLIAVCLGAWLAKEPVTESIILAGIAIIVAVALMTTGNSHAKLKKESSA